MDQYRIVATDRSTGKRVQISGLISKTEADYYKPSAQMKKLYKYFRVAKHIPKYKS